MNADRGGDWIVGCGDIGCRLALRLRAEGGSPLGLVRSAAGLRALRRFGMVGARVDLDAEDFFLPEPPPDRLFYLVPPPRQGDTDRRLRRLLDRLPAPPRRLLYLSTSAVYGDCAGRWIDEDQPPRPAHARARRRLDAEIAALDYARRRRLAALIVRVPGIYGPGRLPAARLAAGDPLPAREQAPYSNRIHAEDLVTALLAVAERGVAGAAYHASDGAPVPTTDYLLACAAALGLAPPPQRPLAEVLARASAMQREFLLESKRLRNDRLRALGWTPRYADFRRGLASALATDRVAAARTVD